MPYYDFIWTDDRIEHLADNDVTPEDFEEIVRSPIRSGTSRSSGRPAAWGYTADGRYVMTIFEKFEDGITVSPVTAFEVQEPDF